MSAVRNHIATRPPWPLCWDQLGGFGDARPARPGTRGARSVPLLPANEKLGVEFCILWFISTGCHQPSKIVW